MLGTFDAPSTVKPVYKPPFWHSAGIFFGILEKSFDDKLQQKCFSVYSKHFCPICYRNFFLLNLEKNLDSMPKKGGAYIHVYCTINIQTSLIKAYDL